MCTHTNKYICGYSTKCRTQNKKGYVLGSEEGLNVAMDKSYKEAIRLIVFLVLALPQISCFG